MHRLTVVTSLLLLAVFVIAETAGAEVFKYRDANGHILLTDKPVRGLQLLKRYQIPTGRSMTGSGNALAAMRKRRDALQSLIAEASRDSRLEPALVHAVVRAESAYRADAVSPKGAIGLMQLMPATAERYGVSDPRDPAQNLRGGTRYLRDLLAMFDNDLKLALAAYNAGENAVIRYGNQVPPYDETREYVRKVVAFFNQMSSERVALR
ncbi:MAG: lytic transglycosylase domain-containing protein [Gammaproteobacteria bacterium]|nr:lytic transglycosylase domain-containing protein [Gammaproteobacteria bacterium]